MARKSGGVDSRVTADCSMQSMFQLGAVGNLFQPNELFTPRLGGSFSSLAALDGYTRFGWKTPFFFGWKRNLSITAADRRIGCTTSSPQKGGYIIDRRGKEARCMHMLGIIISDWMPPLVCDATRTCGLLRGASPIWRETYACVNMAPLLFSWATTWVTRSACGVWAVPAHKAFNFPLYCPCNCFSFASIASIFLLIQL